VVFIYHKIYDDCITILILMSKYYENINKFLDLGIALAFARATMLVNTTVGLISRVPDYVQTKTNMISGIGLRCNQVREQKLSNQTRPKQERGNWMLCRCDAICMPFPSCIV
jgi:hypothetical protein